MIKANLRLVVKIAMDYKDFGLPLLDLISEGNIGLVKAVERFDPRTGGKLSTYAAWWIKQSIKRALANQSKTIRLPVHLVEKISQDEEDRHGHLRAPGPRADRRGARDGAADPDLEGCPPQVRQRAPRRRSTPPVGEDGDSATFGEIVGDENATSPYDNLRDKNLNSDLPLDGRLARQARGRDHPQCGSAWTAGASSPWRRSAGASNVTRERIRQLEYIALGKMRRAMAKNEALRNSEDIEQEDPPAQAHDRHPRIHRVQGQEDRSGRRELGTRLRVSYPKQKGRRQ